ncbi:1-acyl-sn-glycerol-3-phosphate acyltransferase [Thalassotalea profundi]|uniref:Acyltransferase n=1 Tax=Thalassotalea profundi TaxID=2036687 RepID=A0ABQ3IAN6_9GAMM|nr:1-acyl-sn-glycerol-3-phosphate acyltransferase [Thalassotalea profundi]GHE76957.1 acyltransferase [Thalassotalea profundi]
MFEDIRPYRDNEVVDVLKKLANEPELINAIATFLVPKLTKRFPSLTRKIVQWSLKKKIKNWRTIDDIQLHVAKYLHKLVENSTKGFSYDGVDNLDFNKPILFISNHRDIVLDVALINWALFKCNAKTVEAAVGDNLLHKTWVADLMRINKSFIVKRSEKTKREMLTASKTLSAYIHHSLTDNQQNIWIAQREGRAKDGMDKTNAALISMLLLNKDKAMPISDYLAELNIVPVSISYEFDPCDHDKAIELAQKETNGDYKKTADEDLKSITQGIVGQKGRIHIAFGDPIIGDFTDSKAIAAEIDRQIINNYKLYESNQSAYQVLHNEIPENELIPQLLERVKDLSEVQKRWLLTMYANPVFAKKSLTANDIDHV